jgi:hypothetical protein
MLNAVFASDATLQVCGPVTLTDDSNVMICNDTHMICIECEVTESFSFRWTLEPLYSPVQFRSGDDVGKEVERSPITLTLTDIGRTDDQAVFKSRFQTFSNELRSTLKENDGILNVGCRVSDTVRDNISIVLPAEFPPKIESANVNTTSNQLHVQWSTRHTAIVNIVIIAKNDEIKLTTIVDWCTRETTIHVDPAFYYNVTVVIYDKCRERHESEVVHVYEHLPGPSSVQNPAIASHSSKSEGVQLHSPILKTTDGSLKSTASNRLLTSTSIFIPHSTERMPNVNKREPAVIALSIVLVLALLLIAVLLVVLIFVLLRKKESTLHRVDITNQGSELKESEAT